MNWHFAAVKEFKVGAHAVQQQQAKHSSMLCPGLVYILKLSNYDTPPLLLKDCI